jgi:hypothetical protein
MWVFYQLVICKRTFILKKKKKNKKSIIYQIQQKDLTQDIKLGYQFFTKTFKLG